MNLAILGLFSIVYVYVFVWVLILVILFRKMEKKGVTLFISKIKQKKNIKGGKNNLEQGDSLDEDYEGELNASEGVEPGGLEPYLLYPMSARRGSRK